MISNFEVGPLAILFHTTGEPRKKYRASIFPYLLNAAKILIPKYWKSKKISY